MEKIEQDPFLVAYALSYRPDVTVVTKEVSAPSKIGANRKVPDVCRTGDLGPAPAYPDKRSA
jgi:hypothetical protein